MLISLYTIWKCFLKKFNNRILLDWNKQVFSDSDLNLPTLSFKKHLDGGISFLGEDGNTYKIKWNGRRTVKGGIRCTYLNETRNNITSLYRCLAPCRLYLNDTLIHSEVEFIIFYSTVSSYEPVYEQSNWSVEYGL